MNFACLVKKLTEGRQNFDGGGLATCRFLALWSSNLPREGGTSVVGPSQTERLIQHLPHPRNNPAIRIWGLLHERLWKQGYSDTRDARTMRLKGWRENVILVPY